MLLEGKKTSQANLDQATIRGLKSICDPIHPPDIAEKIPFILWILWSTNQTLKAQFSLKNTKSIDEFLFWFLHHGSNQYKGIDSKSILTETQKFRLFFEPHSKIKIGPFFVNQYMLLLQKEDPYARKHYPNLDRFYQMALIGWFYQYYVSDHGLSWLFSDEQIEELKTLKYPEASLAEKIYYFSRPDFWEKYSLNANRVAQLKEYCICNQHELLPAALHKPQKSVLNEKTQPPRFGINIFGHAKGVLGIGEDVRMLARACDAVNIPWTVVDVPLMSSADNVDETVSTHISLSAPYFFNVFCLPAFSHMVTAFSVNSKLLLNRYNIGYWPWELEKFPQELKTAFTISHEIWAATDFTLNSFRAAQPTTPILKVGLCSELPPDYTKDSHTRRIYGIPENKFVIGFFFDINSSLRRKNPSAVIKAFRRAQDLSSSFKENTFCVVKSMYGSEQDIQEMSVLLKDVPSKWISDRLQRRETLRLLESLDAFVSLHRAEGYGRLLAESMLLNVPVIATDYSGNVDFCNEETSFPVRTTLTPLNANDYPFGAGQRWAEPDIEHAAHQMLSCYTDTEARQRKTQRAFKKIRSISSSNVVGARIHKRLKEIWEHVTLAPN